MTQESFRNLYQDSVRDKTKMYHVSSSKLKPTLTCSKAPRSIAVQKCPEPDSDSDSEISDSDFLSHRVPNQQPAISQEQPIASSYM